MNEDNDELAEKLGDGWEICGFDVAMMAAGAVAQYILLRKDNSVGVFTLVANGSNELGRGFKLISPPPPRKKGFFG